MDPVSPSVMAKVVAPLASKFAVTWFNRLTRARRAAKAATKKANVAGIAITAKSLRVWLGRADTEQQLQQCTAQSLEQAAARLVFLLPGDEPARRRIDALEVLRIVMEEYVRVVAPSEAALLTSGWARQTTVEDGARTRVEARELHGNLVARLNARTDFESALQSFSPWSAQEARRLRFAWPAVETAVGVLADITWDRAAVLKGWACEEPEWLRGAAPQALAWLGGLAVDYGARSAAQTFFEGCLREGGHPRDFLLARAALQSGSGSAYETQQYLEAHHGTPSPLLEALRAYLDEDWDGCIGCLRRWEPRDASARSMRVQLEAAALIGLDRQSEALALLRTADGEGLFTSVTVRLAETLLQHSALTASRLACAQEALAVAVRARNNRRNWYADSAEAAVLAVQAAVLCGDLAAAWRMTQPSPEGEATAHEADDDRMREQTALVAALTGRLREAEQLAESLNSPFIKAQVMALIAEMRLDGESENPQVQGLWRQAWGAAQTDSEQLVAAMGLAEAGGDLPDLAHLRARFAESVTEIELLARALRGRAGDELGVLRANITQSPVIVLKLAQRYRRGGDVPMAAQTLQEGARQFQDVRLMVMAASLYREAGDHSHVRECAHSALTMGGADWAGRGRIYALLVEVESADGRMPQATDAALQLLALDPWDTDARWALVKCYTGRAMPEQAWQVLAASGTPLQPRNQDEALLWVGLGADMSTDRHFIGHAMALMQRWPDDEELLGRLLGALHWRAVGKVDDLSEEDAEQLRTATATFLERFPNSVVFRAIAVGPPDNPTSQSRRGIASHPREHQ